MSAADGAGDEGERLIQLWVDQELDPAQQERLERWLSAAPEHRRRFLVATHLHRQLGDQLGARAGARVVPRRAQPPRPPRRGSLRRRSARRLAIALGVAALVMAGVGWWLAMVERMAPPAGAPSARQDLALAPSDAHADWEITEARDCRLGRAHERVAAGALRSGQELETGPAGFAIMRAPDGTQLRLGPDSRCAPQPGASDGDRRAPSLLQGSLACEVAKQDPRHPFTIATPGAAVTVVGTRFTVASDQGETTVAVASGVVQLVNRRTRERADIAAGQSGLAAADEPLMVHASAQPWGRVLAVGPGQRYASLAELPALAPGDLVEIAAGSYHEARRWVASGTALRPIVIRAAPGADVRIDGTGLDLSGVGPIPRALFQLEGAHVRIEGIAFAHAGNHENAAGVRVLQGVDITIADCAITDCDNGIDGEGDGIRIEGCRITGCGTPANEGYCHDCYIDGGSSLVIRGCVLTGARDGQALKCAAHRIRIEGCRVGLSQDGEISILDPPDGPRPDDRVELLGDAVLSRPDRHGNHRRFLEIDAEHGHPRLGTLVLAYDTLVAQDARVRLIDLAQGALSCVLIDNILVGSDPLIIAGGDHTGTRNWLPEGVPAPLGWQRSLVGAGDGPGFSALGAGDLRLQDDASAADAAVPLDQARSTADVMPPQLQPPVSDDAPALPRTSWRDLGAYEHEGRPR